ncbi:6345_t:CDS:2, partial [Cetraspora pellucida]
SQLPTQEEINQLQKASLVTNTEKNMSKWLRTLDWFNKSCGKIQSIELIDNTEVLENYLYEFITWLKKKDGSDYKDRYKFPRALRILNRKMRTLQSKGLGDPRKSDELTSKEIEQILTHPYMDTNSNKSLCHRVFFWLCLLCGLRGSNAYHLNRNDLQHHHDGGLELILNKEKNNQNGAFYRNIHGKTGSQHISIPPNSFNNQYTPVKDILLYLSKLSDSTSSQDPLFHETYLKKDRWFKSNQMDYTKLRKMLNDIAMTTEINLDNNWLITNHSCHRTAIQLLKNNGVSESELQAFSEHCSCESLADYCQTSDNQHLTNTAMLIPYSPQELDLDEFEYNDCYKNFLDEELDVDNISISHEIQAQNSPNFIIQEVQQPTSPANQPLNTMGQETQQVSRIPRLKPCIKNNPYSASSVMASFKPPCHPDSPMFALYGKRQRPLS